MITSPGLSLAGKPVAYVNLIIVVISNTLYFFFGYYIFKKYLAIQFIYIFYHILTRIKHCVCEEPCFIYSFLNRHGHRNIYNH